MVPETAKKIIDEEGGVEKSDGIDRANLALSIQDFARYCFGFPVRMQV